MRILIVDDSSAMRTFLRETLESANTPVRLEVSEADGGLEALRLLPRGPYALVITDINMSGVNGLELLNFIRNADQHRKTKVLLISTQAAERDKQRGLSLGADAFLAKPFASEKLLSVVDGLLRGGER